MRIACLLFFLQIVGLTQPKAFAQEFPAAIKPLTIGDTVPDVVLENIINYPSSSARLSHFKGKLLILDFWATWCGSCVKKLPAVNQLQNRFGDKLQFLMVNTIITGDSSEKIDIFVDKLTNAISSFNIPVVKNDSLLLRYFPHSYLPHYVWIGSDRQILAITGSSEITAPNISAAIAALPLSLKSKKDRLAFDKQAPLFSNENGAPYEKIRYSSTFSGFLEGVGAGFHQYRDSLQRRLTWRNVPLINIYRWALGFQGNRMILEVSDPNRFLCTGGNLQAWSDHLYSYELTIPAGMPEHSVKSFITQDLNRYNQLYGRLEKRIVNCWTLVSKGVPLYRSSSGKSAEVKTFDGCTEIVNLPINDWIDQLNTQRSCSPLKPIIINETGYTGAISISFFGDSGDIIGLKDQLNAYGLDLVKAQRELDVFVLSETGLK